MSRWRQGEDARKRTRAELLPVPGGQSCLLQVHAREWRRELQLLREPGSTSAGRLQKQWRTHLQRSCRWGQVARVPWRIVVQLTGQLTCDYGEHVGGDQERAPLLRTRQIEIYSALGACEAEELIALVVIGLSVVLLSSVVRTVVVRTVVMRALGVAPEHLQVRAVIATRADLPREQQHHGCKNARYGGDDAHADGCTRRAEQTKEKRIQEMGDSCKSRRMRRA